MEPPWADLRGESGVGALCWDPWGRAGDEQQHSSWETGSQTAGSGRARWQEAGGRLPRVKMTGVTWCRGRGSKGVRWGLTYSLILLVIQVTWLRKHVHEWGGGKPSKDRTPRREQEGLEILEKQAEKMQPEVTWSRSLEIWPSRWEMPQSRNTEAQPGWWEFAIRCGGGKGLGTLGGQKHSFSICCERQTAWSPVLAGEVQALEGCGEMPKASEKYWARLWGPKR